jgi:hypothetical protein
MKKPVLLLVILIGLTALLAQPIPVLDKRPDSLSPEIWQLVNDNQRQDREFSFNFDSSPYNLPDQVDIDDPLTGLFYEDVAWAKDFSRHIVNPESTELSLSFLIPPAHFTVSQPDPGNPLKLQFLPIPGNWYGSEVLVLVATDLVTRTEAMAVIRLNVTSVPDPPVWSGLPDGDTYTTNEETALQINFQDYVDCIDSADPENFDLYLTPAVYPIDIVQEPAGTGSMLTFTPQTDYNGTATYELTAVDRLSNAYSTHTIYLNVLGVNDPPTITLWQPVDLTQVTDQGSTLSFSVTVQDVESDPLDYTWTHSGTQNGVPFSQVVSTTSTLDLQFNIPGTQSISCVVSDGTDTDSLEWTVSVRPYGPLFDPIAGTYTGAINVSLAPPAGFEGAVIHYTTDDSEPDESSPVYGEPIPIPILADVENVVTVKAFFIYPEYPSSQTVSQTYTVTGTVSDPVCLPLGGLFYEAVDVVISSSNPLATIHYTTDGSDPVPGAPGTMVYSDPITIPANTVMTLKALATRAGWLDSSIIAQTYQVTGTVVLDSHTMMPPPLPDGEFYTVEPGESLAVEIAGLAMLPSGASLYYTLDNSLPGPDNPTSLIYTPGQQILLTNPTWIKLRAFLTDWLPSETFSYYYDVRTRTKILPYGNGTVFDPAPGYSTVPLSVSISGNTNPAGAAVYYTTDGSDPTPDPGLLYTGPIPVSQTTTIKAIAQYPGLYPSEIYTGSFSITGTVDAPAFAPAPGSYAASLDLVLSTILGGTSIYYTLDGSEPSDTSPTSFLYYGSVALGIGQHQVRARAYKEYWDPSPVSEGFYNIGILPAPQFDLAAGLYFDPIVVHLSVPTVPEAAIYYTTDGSDPTESSSLYNESAGIPVGLQTSITIKAIAIRTGWISSAISERSYQVTGTVATPAFAPDGGVYTAATVVTISTSTPDAVIRYTLDGQDPTLEYGTTYEGPVTIASSATLKARAFKTDWRPSETYGAVYTIFGNIADPVFIPGAGTYTAPIDVYISVNPPDASIYYTSDGSEPSTTNGTLYATGTPINVAADVLLRAVAFKTGWNPSGVVDAQYHITGTVGTPEFTPPSGQYATVQTVAINVTPAEATIVYTTDGSDPSHTNGTVYAGPLQVAANTMIKAFAWLDGWDDSPVSTASYVINGPVGTPVINPAEGYYNTPQTVSISVYPPAATIRYTLDGSDPSQDNGITYAAPFAIEGHTVVKAFAYLDNWVDSAIAESEYFFVVANPVLAPPAGSYASAQTVTITSNTIGASVRYTLDGSDPTPDYGTVYTAPFQVATSATVKAIAYRSDWISSNIVTHTYVINGPVADPLFSLPGGDYYANISVGITTLPATATIYYTTDGTDPSEFNGTVYSAPVSITQNTTLKARAYRTNWLPSDISTAVYNFFASPVSIFPNGGTFTENQMVTLSTVTAGSTISYTLDGSDPVPGVSPIYNPLEPVLVDHDLILKAMASKDNWYPSQVTSAAFDINIPLPDVEPLVILPPSGVYNTPQTVTITTTTPDVTIVYTTDGTDPTLTNGTIYAGSFVVSDNILLKARGFKDGYDPSPEATVQYIIVIPIETVATPTFNPPAGIYDQPIQVAISTLTPEATIRYTIDGTEPSETIGFIYSGPVSISVTTTIKAIAYKTGMNTSLISNASYVINIVIPEVASPMFSLPSGNYYQPISVEISTTTESALIRYTTDGSVPSPTYGTLYLTPILIPSDTSMFIQAIAYRDGWTPSPVVSANYNVTGTVADVAFNPMPGIYTQVTSVILTTATAGATIRYTTDGSQPTETSNLYNTAIIVPLNTTLTINARAFKTGWQSSNVTQGTYTVTGQVAITQPVFSLTAGTYTSAQTVAINTPVPSDATIRYTTDGSDPTTTSPVYSAPIVLPLNTTMTLKARAFRDNWIPSPLYSASYVITGQVVLPAVLFNPPAGTYQTAQSVALNPPSLPTDATLRYTLDGSEPSLNSPAYQNPISLALNSTTTIKVKGFRTDWIPSATASATYIITGQVVFNTPVFSPAPGVYATAQQITVNGTVPADAVIHYTIDGSDPTDLSPVYTIPIPLPLDTSLTLKVRAYKANWTPSAIQTGTYTTTGAVSIALPVFTPSPGLYTSPQSVSINTTTIPAGATLRYTLDGSDPNESSPVYTTPINVSTGQTVTIRVRAYTPNWQPSVIYTGVYTVTGQVSIAEPVFTPPSGTYQTVQTVILNTSTTPAGATLRYTLDGSEPTASSPAYTTGIQLALGTVTTIKVKAYLTNWLPSPTYSAIYTITGALSIQEPVFTPPAGIYQTEQSVSINTATNPAGATIRYTTDGSTPTAASPAYTNPIAVPLNTVMTIKAVAFLTGWTPSQVYEATYTVTGQVQLPAQVFNPPAGTYQTAQSVTMNTNTVPTGATLRYTLDGSIPSENSPAYTTPIQLPLNSTTTISVKAFKLNWTPSVTATATYLITGQIAFQTPVFSPEPGIYQTAQNVAVAATVPADATVRYTTDGSEPTASSTVYTGPISLPLNSNTTIKVKAFKTDWTASATHTGVYTITGQAAISAPVFSPAPGTYQTAQSLTINTSTTPAGAQIRYTLDGTEPTSSSTLYTVPIPLALNNTYEVRVRAYASNWAPSEVYVGYYTITGSVTIPDPVFTPAAGTYTTDISLVLNTQTIPAGAILRYSLDGTEPNESYPQYNQPVMLYAPSEVTVKVKAYKADWLPSQTYTAQYTLTGQMQLMPPYLDPAPGVYTEPISVTSAGGTNPTGGIIRYTTDGSIPTEQSPPYSSPIEIGLNTLDFTITIRAFMDGWLPSEPRAGVYSVTGQVMLAEDIFTPAPGIYQTAQSVSLALPEMPADAIIRYTTDGSEPTVNSAVYTSPIQVSLGTVLTIKAKGFASGWIASETRTGVFTVTGTVAPPVFSPPGGTYGAPVYVVISTPTDGAEIRYTTDGSEPDATSELYTEQIIVPNFTPSMVITAKAFKEDWTASPAASATYSVLSSPVDIRGFTYAGYIRVLWNLPGTIRALQGFNIYRRALGEAAFTKINEGLVNTQVDDNYYYDDYTIVMDVSYEYYVTAVYDGVESPASATTVEYYQSQDLDISDASCAYPNPAQNSTTIKLVLNRNDNVQLAVSIFDFAGKKVRTITVPPTDSNLIEVPWDLKNANGIKVGRGTYFARVVANDGVNRSERVIKIAVK